MYCLVSCILIIIAYILLLFIFPRVRLQLSRRLSFILQSNTIFIIIIIINSSSIGIIIIIYISIIITYC